MRVCSYKWYCNVHGRAFLPQLNFLLLLLPTYPSTIMLCQVLQFPTISWNRVRNSSVRTMEFGVKRQAISQSTPSLVSSHMCQTNYHKY
ncbi:hypothetical protein BDR07DRAFT_285302 [Suillus spraguei]|nr:hypothetical protein BDR07DRAFT_285302 [Suillus spraguei]